jgi:hypothetical protein
MDIKRKDAAALIDSLSLRIAERLQKDPHDPVCKELKEMLLAGGVDVPRPCNGEIHGTEGDGCGVCLRGFTWGWMGSPTKVK